MTSAGSETHEDLFDELLRAGRSSLGEHQAKALISEHGVPVPSGCFIAAGDLDGLSVAKLAERLDTLTGPYVLKVVSADILHKSDVGGVRLNLADADEVHAAIAQMRALAPIAAASLDGFLVEQMSSPG
ncbi:MAG: acetate--CoA ligase family protein, partial [Gammaproteobacteria bacterium]|nr:acetate--CoA ligase family protein [Gammaproteobacteria bacterium]